MLFQQSSKPGFQHILGLPVAYEISVGAVVFRRVAGQVRYLLLRYPHGHWDYVKGHVEAGEGYIETLKRETMEETGIENISVIPGFREKTRYFYTAKGSEREKRLRSKKGLWIFKVVYFYLAESSQFEVSLSHEHIDYGWFPYGEAVNRLTFPAAKSILRSANDFVKKMESEKMKKTDIA